MNDPAGSHDVWMCRCAKLTAGSTFLLVIAGGLVTSTESGLAVPDWPLSYGQFFPPMVGGIFYEHSHRMIATFVGFLTTVLAVWLWRREPRRWVRNLGWGALLAVITQGVLGGITVLFLLPTPVSVGHAMLAQTFFCWTVSLALFTSREWWQERKTVIPSNIPSIRGLAISTTAAIYLQLLLGAVMRHTKAGLSIPDFPLAFGRILPEFTDAKIAIHFAHRLGALLVGFFLVWTVIRIMSHYRDDLKLLVPAVVLVALYFLQFSLGAATIWSQKAVFPTTAHVAIGALILATSVLLTLSTFRFLEITDNTANLELSHHQAGTESPA